MGNYRCERMFVMLERAIPGLDHLKAVDPVELAWHQSNADAESLGVPTIEDFCIAAFDGPPPWREKPRWLPAAEGPRGCFTDRPPMEGNAVFYLDGGHYTELGPAQLASRAAAIEALRRWLVANAFATGNEFATG